ncbi:nucleotidyltransferase family protein [Akkermansiaceae bacterium]|nr:nucleotidyltransferase family protein [Akkermansiaceae bacterium]
MVERLFIAALSSDRKVQLEVFDHHYEQVGEDALWEFSENEGCSCIVASNLRRIYGSEMVADRWLKSAGEIEQKLTLYLEQLDRVAAIFWEKDIPLVALKNSGIARGIYRDLAGCPMGDVDVLVCPSDFRKAHETMLELGYEMDDRSPFKVESLDEAEQHGGSEYTCQLADGSTLWFELQWRPVAGRWIQPDQEPPADELLARSVAIDGSRVRLLSPEDNLLQVCLHTAKHSYVRAPGFRLHTDVDRIVRACAVDWDVFCQRVERVQVMTAVYLSLSIPAVFLGTSIPEEVLARLNHSPVKHWLLQRWIVKAGLFGPHDSKWSKLGYICFNLMLYDNIGGVLRGIFPDAYWMAEHYGIKRRWTLPFWYGVRILELVCKRAKT